MIKYAIVTNPETGACQVGLGSDIEYYTEIGMTQLDVEQSDIDNSWYLTDKCPHKSELEKLKEAQEVKYTEANQGAKNYLEGGNALFEFDLGKHIEATDGNIGKFTAYALAYVTGQLAPTDTVVWNTKEDETVELTQQQVSTILMGLGQVQAVVWSIKFPAYLEAIQNAQTAEEVNAIVIDYSED